MIPLCYFPSQVVLVDDDPDFLSNLEILLHGMPALYVPFSSPRRGLDYINDEATVLELEGTFLEEKESYELGKESFYLNYSAIMKTALNPSRFAGLSTIIVDFNMPNMNGLQLLESIKYKNVKKILLTGEADEHTAIDAFNKGIIDQFIRKQDPNLLTKVNDAIRTVQLQAFVELTQKSLPPSIALKKNPVFQNIPELQNYFYKVLEENKIVEFYLADSQGTYLLLDENANASGFFIRDEEHFTALESEVLGEAEIPEEIQRDIQNHKRLLCYLPTKDKIFPDDTELKEYLYPANEIKYDEGKVYGAYVPDFSYFKDAAFTSYKEFSTSRS